MKVALRLAVLLSGCLLLGTPATPVHAGGADPAYPSLDDKQLGHIRHIVELARQPDDDWSEMLSGDRSAFDNTQFQIAWMYYGLAVAQSQQTPAYRELYQATSDRLIEKMLLPATWSLWSKIIEAPQFKKYLDTTKDWRDPVRSKNIMYSGHLLQMIGLYELLYHDGKYDRPGAIRFAITGQNPFVSRYDHKSLAKLIHKQFVDSAFKGVECEPNLVFAECNQHPVLGLINYDQLHGSKLADIKAAFWDRAMALGYLDAKNTQRFMGPYLLKEETLRAFPSGWNDGWSGVTLHGWNREVVREVYPTQRDATLPALIDTRPEVFKARWNQGSVSTDFGFLAAYAAEVGDGQTVRTMLAFADARFRPVWRYGRYFYPVNDVKVPGAPVRLVGDEVPGNRSNPAPKPLSDAQLGDYLVGPLTGNALLAFARLNPGAGLWKLYHELARTFVADGPQVVGVSYPKLLVRQAYYDRSNGTLAIGIVPGSSDRERASFMVRDLPNGSYRVKLDGRTVASLSGRRITPLDSDLSLEWAGKHQLRFAFATNTGRMFRIERVDSTASR